MIDESLQQIDIQHVNKYISMVASGEFYKQMSEYLYPGLPFDKQKMKDMMFTFFFSHNRYIGQPGAEVKRHFVKMFPDVYKIFKIIKRHHHSALSHILQRIESEIIVQKVSGRIAKEKPDLPIFTVHDSVATTVGNEEYVKNIIREEVLKLTGLNAMVGYEYWEDTHLNSTLS